MFAGLLFALLLGKGNVCSTGLNLIRAAKQLWDLKQVTQPSSKNDVLSVVSTMTNKLRNWSRVRKQNKYEIAGYAQVKANYPEVANYIAELEERIRTLLLQGDHSPERPSHKVSLSASGLAFADDRIMQTGDTLELNLTLFPQLQKINCRGRIVSVGDASEVSEGAKRTYRVEFTDLSADDASSIDKHVKSLEGNVSRYTEV